MTRAEMLRLAAEAHDDWARRYGDDILYVDGDENPHPGRVTDLPLFNADRSAPSEIEEELSMRLMSLIAQAGPSSS